MNMLRVAKRGLVALSLLVAVTVAAIFTMPARELTQQESAVLGEIFPANLRLDSIRIAQMPLPPALTGFVLENRVSFRRGYYKEDFSRDPYKMKQLVHEVAHVWVNQNHNWYTSIGAVFEHLLWGDSVYVWKPDGRVLGDYRLEQQARIFETYFWQRHLGEDVVDLQRLIDPTGTF